MGGKFPMPVCYYNTELDTSMSPPSFSINYISTLYMYFALEMVGLLGCNSPISGVNTIVIFFNITTKKFHILDCLIVYFLLDWLDFWAEVHLVQEEIDLSQKGLEKQNF